MTTQQDSLTDEQVIYGLIKALKLKKDYGDYDPLWQAREIVWVTQEGVRLEQWDPTSDETNDIRFVLAEIERRGLMHCFRNALKEAWESSSAGGWLLSWALTAPNALKARVALKVLEEAGENG